MDSILGSTEAETKPQVDTADSDFETDAGLKIDEDCEEAHFLMDGDVGSWESVTRTNSHVSQR